MYKLYFKYDYDVVYRLILEFYNLEECIIVCNVLLELKINFIISVYASYYKARRDNRTTYITNTQLIEHLNL